MSCSCMWALRSIVSSARSMPAASSLPIRSSRVQPSIALSGVRSSCDSVARNSSFARLAARELVGAPAEIVFEPLAFGDVAHHHGRTRAGLPSGRVHRPSSGRAHRMRRRRGARGVPRIRAALSPRRSAGARPGARHRARRRYRRRTEFRPTISSLAIAEHARGSRIPADDLTVGRQHADGVVMHAVEEDAHAFFLLAQALGLVVHLGVERNDPAVGLLHLGLQLQQGASEVCVLLGQCGSLHLRRIGNAAQSRPAVRRRASGRDTASRRENDRAVCATDNRSTCALSSSMALRSVAVRSALCARSTLMINCSSLAGPVEITVSAAPAIENNRCAAFVPAAENRSPVAGSRPSCSARRRMDTVNERSSGSLLTRDRLRGATAERGCCGFNVRCAPWEWAHGLLQLVKQVPDRQTIALGSLENRLSRAILTAGLRLSSSGHHCTRRVQWLGTPQSSPVCVH